MSLKIKNLHISADSQEIVKGIDLEIKPGEVHVIMGPNGSGKSTLANTLMGHPKYTVTKGDMFLGSEKITKLPADQRAKLGLFLSMQYTPDIPGVTITNFLRMAKESLTGQKQNPIEFYKSLKLKMQELGIDPEFASRYIGVGFSGGEKKQLEVLQLQVLNPKYAILDETDSGLDVDALKAVSNGVNQFRDSEKGVLIVTHYNRILEYIKPDFVHIMRDGEIVKTGEAYLAKQIEEKGYTSF